MMTRAEYLAAEIKAAEHRLATLVLSDADRANLAGWVWEMKEELAMREMWFRELEALDAIQERDRAAVKGAICRRLKPSPFCAMFLARTQETWG